MHANIVHGHAVLMGLLVWILPGGECLSPVIVYVVQEDISATDWSLVQRGPTKYVHITECDQMQP